MSTLDFEFLFFSFEAVSTTCEDWYCIAILSFLVVPLSTLFSLGDCSHTHTHTHNEEKMNCLVK